APVLRQIARYLPHHRSENASKTHPKSSHDKFKTASYQICVFCGEFYHNTPKCFSAFRIPSSSTEVVT
ncbi:hypothetical protein, partial [Bacteroides gallinaceum]|uniref:hypothetical protein n=1 Tax=Bacteroides gallinaceum TaxID=1462571 RepID=UPI00195624C0